MSDKPVGFEPGAGVVLLRSNHIHACLGCCRGYTGHAEYNRKSEVGKSCWSLVVSSTSLVDGWTKDLYGRRGVQYLL